MMSPDVLRELHFALVEGEVPTLAVALRRRFLARAFELRPPGPTSSPALPIDGAECLRRTTEQLGMLLTDLRPDEWGRPALRDLSVQGLVGHLIAVEGHFAEAVSGISPDHAQADHVASTQAVALEQARRRPDETLSDWRAAVRHTFAALRRPAVEQPALYGICLPLDLLLVVRAFELWIHDEDIRRATGRPLAAPAAPVLARMTSLAVALLPAGLERAGRLGSGERVHLVLTGDGGGSWDVGLRGSASQRARTDQPRVARVVVDAAAFCRVVGDRADLESSGSVVDGAHDAARDLFAAAAALAFD